MHTCTYICYNSVLCALTGLNGSISYGKSGFNCIMTVQLGLVCPHVHVHVHATVGVSCFTVASNRLLSEWYACAGMIIIA